MLVILTALFVVGWVAVALIGSLTYFLGEQSKPIHERNWRSESFEKLSQSITGKKIDFSDRVPAFTVSDAYSSNGLPDA
jgi:tyrosyl-tRNA synthetase